MPHYKKAFDIGTYTGNGTQYRVGIPTLRGVGPTGTQVAGSLRFRETNVNYLQRTPAGSGTRTTWTWSQWFKVSVTGISNIFTAGWSGAGYLDAITINSSNVLQFFLSNNAGNGQGAQLLTTLKILDTSVWYHLVAVVDTTQATDTNRMKMYLNGQQISSFSSAAYPTQNFNTTYVNTANVHRIGIQAYTGNITSENFDGYMSECYFIDGQALTPSSFGEYNSDGIWVPKAYSGTYGTNGFYLPMNSSSNYATDQSGNGNNWTPYGFNTTTANTTYDLFTDSPTDYGTDTGAGAQVRGNYAIMASIHNSGSQASVINGGLTATKTTSSGFYNLMFSSLPLSSGKWYWEVTIGSTGDISIGITTSIAAERTAGSAGTSSSGYVYHNWNGQKRNNGTSSAYGSSSTQNDVIGVALDMDNGTLTFYKNNVSQGTAFTGITGTAYAEIGDAGNTLTTGHMNFGQRAFAYTAPSGFKAVCTANITRPADSSLWFYGDTPDLMWIKNRSTTGLHTLTDTVRGPGLNLVTSSTAAETSYSAVSEMNKFGMSVINDATSILNGSTNSHVYWAWKAGSNTSSTSVTNTDGTITSQVSVNRQAGFSIVSWTGTGASSASVGHGLGTGTPNFVIIKKRNATEGWYTCHSSSGQGLNYAYHLFLNTTGALVGSNDPYLLGSQSNDNKLYLADGTSSNGGNQSGINYVAYCWTAIPGYSAFGSYTGNSSTDGPFVYLGFRPRFIMLKNTSNIAGPSNWVIIDAVRNTYNVSGSVLNPNTSGAESAAYGTCMDILSNGFKIRIGADGNFNYTGDTLVYAAFAEIPFKFARAR